MKKRTFTYPGSDFDRGKVLLASLGTFWADIYEGSDQVTSYATATAEIVTQSYNNLLSVLAGISRYDVDVFHKELLSPIRLRKEDVNAINTTRFLFDNTDKKFDEAELFFSRQIKQELYAFPLPENLVRIGYIFNKIAFPTLSLTNQVDFIIDQVSKAIIFSDNPFDNAALTKNIVGDAANEEMTLWGFSCDYDYNYVFNQFAYALGLKLRSSEGYKQLMNAIFSGLVDGGLSSKTLDLALTAITGIPLALDHERVETIRDDRHGLFIATDKNVYRFNCDVEVVVKEGQVITPGTYLIAGLTVSEFFTGNKYKLPEDDKDLVCYVQPEILLATNDYETMITESTGEDILVSVERRDCQKIKRDLSQLALDSGFLLQCFWGDLVFENKDVPLEIDESHESGYTFVRFSLGGYPADVDRFFDELHARGVDLLENPPDLCKEKPTRGTLARTLDRRKNLTSEPTAATLPAKINPLRFLIENVLRNNVFVVKIVVSALGQNAVGLYNIRHLKKLIPPQTAMIVVFELSGGTENIGPDYVAETVDTFVGMEPILDVVPETLVNDLGATARIISGTCQ